MTFWRESLECFTLLRRKNDPWDGAVNFFLNTTDVEHALSVIEISLIAAEAVRQKERFKVFKMPR